MPIVEAVILLIVLVLFSNILSHYLTFVPVSLLQVALGLGVALIWQVHVPLETDWFLLLFIAPLLFNDGRRFPKQELWRLRGPIFANAILLVFITTVLGGYLIYLIIPQMPLAVAFALAAILSPTDPVAVQSISKRAQLPDTILHLVSGESLINDASGLIAFKYAIAATVTGVFSWSSALGDFLYISLIGGLCGLIMMTGIQLLIDILRRQGVNDVVFNVVLQIATPFVIYLVTEELTHSSGVIAVVTAGTLSHVQQNQVVEESPELRLVTEKMWDILVYSLNGLVFVILGIELPVATKEVVVGNQFNTFQALFYAAMAWLVMLLIRVLWTYTYEVVMWLRHREARTVSFRVALISGLSGVRGAVTMAGVLSIPLTIASGAAFPTRSLTLFVASGVIILSLVVASLILPMISSSSRAFSTRADTDDDLMDELTDEDTFEPDAPRRLTENEARVYIMRLAIQRVEEMRRAENQRAAYDLILDYQFIIRQLEMTYQPDEAMQKVLRDEIQLRQVGLAGERYGLEQLRKTGAITAASYVSAVRRLERAENRLNQMSGQTMPGVIHNWLVILRHFIRNVVFWFRPEDNAQLVTEGRLIERETAKAAIKSLSTYLARTDIDETGFDNQAVYHLIVFYRNRVERAKTTATTTQNEYDQQINQLRVRALGAERSGIQSLLESGHISWQVAARLRQYVNYSENVLVMALDESE